MALDSVTWRLESDWYVLVIIISIIISILEKKMLGPQTSGAPGPTC